MATAGNEPDSHEGEKRRRLTADRHYERNGERKDAKTTDRIVFDLDGCKEKRG